MAAQGDRPIDLDVHTVNVPGNVVFRDMAEETVVLNITTGRYHGVDRIGAEFFQTMRAVPRLSDAVPVLAATFEQPAQVIERDLRAFVRQMLDFGLIELRRSDAPPP